MFTSTSLSAYIALGTLLTTFHDLPHLNLKIVIRSRFYYYLQVDAAKNNVLF